MHLMPSSVSLFIPEGSLSLVQDPGDQVSVVLCLCFCTGVQRQAVSLYISLLFFSLFFLFLNLLPALSSPHLPFQCENYIFCHIASYSFLSFYAGECVQHFPLDNLAFGNKYSLFSFLYRPLGSSSVRHVELSGKWLLEQNFGNNS